MDNRARASEKEASGENVAPRLKLIVAYDGTPFRGWQSQPGGETIQDYLESAFTQVTKEKIAVHGAGRTDAGVHALGQCAHADLPPTKLPAVIWMNALNASLPPQVRVMRCRFVPKTFHARFSARGKVYRYRIATGPHLNPLEVNRAWHITGLLDDRALRACAKAFIGRHDFAGFAANRGTQPTSTVRAIGRLRVRRTASLTAIEFDGDGFLYKMARLMAGAIVSCGLGKQSVMQVREQLRSPAAGGPRLVAPAGGLTLLRVRY